MVKLDGGTCSMEVPVNPLDYLADQLRQPSGLFGELVISRLLNLVNGAKHDLTLELLDPRRGDRVLEVGFGGGALLARVAERVTEGLVAGVDPSPEMVAHGRRRLPPRVELARARVEVLPHPDGHFDKAYTVNTIYFWSNPAAALAELRRVLAGSGLLLVTFGSRSAMAGTWIARRGYRLYEPEEVLDAMAAAGYAGLRLERRETRRGACFCALGRVSTRRS
jgi:SAM-dependent methyltransferase